MTLLLSAADVEALLTPAVCIAAVEDAFRQYALGSVPAPGILGMHAKEGGFHVKAGFLTVEGRPYFAAKLNANFPGNASKHGLPTIQGAVILSDASNGVPLAIMDSISITALRTAAASAVAAKHLAKPECETLLVVGCGGQASSQLQALRQVCKPGRVLVHDQDRGRATAFAAGHGATVAHDLTEASRSSDIIVTCTTATKAFLTADIVRPGTFIAAVGADNEDKQEIDPRLMAAAKVVTDLTEQASRIGDLHHAIAAGVMAREAVHAELGQVIAGIKPGRRNATEITVFDSTGTGLQDVAAAIAVYRRAVDAKAGRAFALAERLENFDATQAGALPEGWESGVTGRGSPRWAVAEEANAPSGRNVLQQSGSGTFPWCVKKSVSLADGFVEVRFKAVRGREDQAGGLVWRWKDGDNYYVARANALENNVSLYHTINGRRNTIKYVDVPVAANTWHTLRAEFAGTAIKVMLNGKTYIDLQDSRISAPGAVGVWTKADSVTSFDDFSYGK